MANAPRTIHSKLPILSVDFDGVIHSYKSGWQGATNIPDPPVEGAFEWLEKMSDYYQIVIHSSRCHERGAEDAMISWFWRHATKVEDQLWLDKLEFSHHKPPAHMTIDDRAVQFEGSFDKFSLDFIRNFKPWHKG